MRARLTSFTELLKRENEPNSTRSAGKLFHQRFTTASEKISPKRAIGKELECMICNALQGCRTSRPAITWMGCRVNKTQIALSLIHI